MVPRLFDYVEEGDPLGRPYRDFEMAQCRFGENRLPAGCSIPRGVCRGRSFVPGVN
jgi:hypothetical protein